MPTLKTVQAIGDFMGSIHTGEFARAMKLANANPLTQEGFLLLTMTGDKDVLSTYLISVGTSTRVDVSLRQVFAKVLKEDAACFVVAHNHCDGMVLPSPVDLKLTKDFITTAQWFQLPILDHLILGITEFYSFQCGSPVPYSSETAPNVVTFNPGKAIPQLTDGLERRSDIVPLVTATIATHKLAAPTSSPDYDPLKDPYRIPAVEPGQFPQWNPKNDTWTIIPNPLTATPKKKFLGGLFGR